MVKIRTELGLPNVEPEGEDGIGIGDPIADDGGGEESDDDTHTASSGRFTVENNEQCRQKGKVLMQSYIRVQQSRILAATTSF